MHSYALFTLLGALLACSRGVDPGDNRIDVVKCCNEYEMLSGDGRSCVKTDWPSNANKSVGSLARDFQVFAPPLNGNWVRRWLPAGLPLHRIKLVIRQDLHGVILPVNTSCEWNNRTCVRENVLKTQVVFFSEGYAVLRPKPGGGLRKAAYCVDAALPPLGPFAMRVRTECTKKECFSMCCKIGQVLANKDGNWLCEESDQGDWTPFNASFAMHIDPEFPSAVLKNCARMRLADRQNYTDVSEFYAHKPFFSIRLPCAAYHRINNTLLRGFFFCEYPRVANGIFWILRPLCFVSTLLLAMVLVSIACDGTMRQKVHGWCLASHALCLFGFNVGQIVYYVQVSDGMKPPTLDIQKACKHFALMMYFLLTAAWFWLTAICINMALGFRLQAALPRAGDKKKFLVFSVLAWGLPALLTITCSFLFTAHKLHEHIAETPWKPSLTEARVCFNEPVGSFPEKNDAEGIRIKYFTYKHGTAIFYYCPVLSLMICNVASLFITLRKIKRLRRGNSVLRRQEDLRQRRAQRNPPSAANIQSATGGTSGSGNGGSSRREVDSKTIKMYLKMIMMSGGLEIISEVIIWTTTQFELKYPRNNDLNVESAVTTVDYHLPYRSSGHVTDFLRAACVAWLAAPEGGYLGPILRRLRGENK